MTHARPAESLSQRVGQRLASGGLAPVPVSLPRRPTESGPPAVNGARALERGDRGRGGGDPAGGMFGGLSSWLGLKQPEGAAAEGGEPPSRDADKLSAGAAPSEESPERPVEPTEEQQPMEDPQFLHQAKGLGSEFSPGPEGRLGGHSGILMYEEGDGPL